MMKNYIKMKILWKNLQVLLLLYQPKSRQITKLLLEFGTGFAFLGRQYPIKVGDKEFFVDLLFYNIKLHCYFVVELKTVDFEPEFTGKLAFYLSAIDGELKSPTDNPTIGLLLCKGKNKMDMVLTYTSNYSLTLIPYVNTGLTEKGPHITQVKTIITREFNKLSNKISKEIQNSLPSIEDIEKRINWVLNL